MTFEVGPSAVLPAVATDLRQASAGGAGILVTQPALNAVAMITPGAGGTMTVSKPFQAGAQPRFLISADIDGDGDSDIVTTSPNTGRAYVVHRNAQGQYALASVLPVGLSPYAPTLADLNADGLPELIIPLRGDNEVAILPNLGKGLFSAGTRLSTGAAPESVGLADFDGDGLLDLAVTCTGTSEIQVFFGSQTDLGLSFPGPPVSLATGNSPSGLVLSDLDGDGRPDLATASVGSSSLSVFYTRSGRTFESAPFLFAGTAPQGIVSADLTMTGLPDLIVANPGVQTVTILQNHGAGGFSRTTLPLPFRPARLSVADLDADGLVDLVATSQTSAHARALLNRTPIAICPGDVTGDLRVDLADLNLVLTHFGSSGEEGDANGDGFVDLADLNLVLTGFGDVCGDR